MTEPQQHSAHEKDPEKPCATEFFTGLNNIEDILRERESQSNNPPVHHTRQRPVRFIHSSGGK